MKMLVSQKFLLISYVERNNKWLTSSGKSPTNLNLFHRLNDTVTSMENDGIDVGFWHIDRKVCTDVSPLLWLFDD